MDISIPRDLTIAADWFRGACQFPEPRLVSCQSSFQRKGRDFNKTELFRTFLNFNVISRICESADFACVDRGKEVLRVYPQLCDRHSTYLFLACLPGFLFFLQSVHKNTGEAVPIVHYAQEGQVVAMAIERWGTSDLIDLDN